MKWFGKWWDSGLCNDCSKVETPVGAVCRNCDEEIVEGDRGVIFPNGYILHLNCYLRAVIGSVAHIRKECSCYKPGSTEHDPIGMTKRQAADAAVAEFYGINRKEQEDGTGNGTQEGED